MNVGPAVDCHKKGASDMRCSLGSVGVGSRVGHGQDARLGVLQLKVLILHRGHSLSQGDNVLPRLCVTNSACWSRPSNTGISTSEARDIQGI